MTFPIKNDKIRKWAYYATCFYSNENIIETLKKNIDKTIFGIRGRQLNEFSELGLPVLPGIVIDATIVQALQKKDDGRALR